MKRLVWAVLYYAVILGQFTLAGIAVWQWRVALRIWWVTLIVGFVLLLVAMVVEGLALDRAVRALVGKMVLYIEGIRPRTRRLATASATLMIVLALASVVYAQIK